MAKQSPPKISKTSQAKDDFIQKMGRHFETQGLPRIAGLILGYLIIKADSATLQNISERLQVSRGSVSTNTRLLENMNLIESYHEASKRQLYYRLDENVFINLIHDLLCRMHGFKAIAQNAMLSFGKPPENLRKMESQFGRAIVFLLDQLEEIRERQDRSQTQIVEESSEETVKSECWPFHPAPRSWQSNAGRPRMQG